MLTHEQQSVLEKFGFVMEQESVKHNKLGIVREREEFVRFTDLDELREYVKQILRNQCQVKRTKG